MKILCIAHGSTLNGAERSFVEMLGALYLKGHTLYVFFPSEGPIIAECKKYVSGYEIFPQPWWMDRGVKLNLKNKLKLIVSFIKAIRTQNVFVKKYSPDLIISNTSTIPSGAIVAKLKGIPHIWYLREFGKKDLGFNFIYGRRFSMYLINKLSSKVFFNSYILESHYGKYISNRKRKVICQAVTLGNEIDKPYNEDLSVILVGRFAAGKGQLEAVKAIHTLKKKKENVKLLLIGSGDDSYSLAVKDYINDHQLADVIDIISFVEDVSVFYRRANVSLVCSRCEAFGRITIESMKMGLPVIASNTGANTELIKNGFNGYIYEYNNINDLASKILLMKDKYLREQMSSQAKEWSMRKFNMDNYSNTLEAEIKEYSLNAK